MERPHSNAYYRAYTEAYDRYYKQFYQPLPSLTPAERNHAHETLASTAHVLAESAAVLAEAREKDGGLASNTPTTHTTSISTPTGASTSLTGTGAWTSYTPSTTFGTPYPTTRAPTESDLRNQSYWNQRNYNRMHETWRAEDSRQDWNRRTYGR